MLLRFVRSVFGLLKKKRYVAHIIDKMAMERNGCAVLGARWIKQNPRVAGVLSGGSDRRRSGDLSIFSRTLYQLSYRARTETYWPGLATPTGLEPATSAVTGRRANQLRYGALQ